MRLFVCLVLALSVVSCSAPSRDQAASDIVAGAEAIAQAAPELAPIAEAIKENALAARGVESVEELPPPSMEPEEIADNPGAFMAKARENHEKSISPGWWASIIAGATLAVGIAARLGLGGPLVNLAASVLHNRATKRQKEHEAALAGFGVRAISVIEELPGPVGAKVKKAVSKAVTPDQEKAIREILEERAKI